MYHRLIIIDAIIKSLYASRLDIDIRLYWIETARRPPLVPGLPPKCDLPQTSQQCAELPERKRLLEKRASATTFGILMQDPIFQLWHHELHRRCCTSHMAQSWLRALKAFSRYRIEDEIGRS